MLCICIRLYHIHVYIYNLYSLLPTRSTNLLMCFSVLDASSTTLGLACFFLYPNRFLSWRHKRHKTFSTFWDRATAIRPSWSWLSTCQDKSHWPSQALLAAQYVTMLRRKCPTWRFMKSSNALDVPTFGGIEHLVFKQPNRSQHWLWIQKGM